MAKSYKMNVSISIDCEDKTVKKFLFTFKNLNKTINYLALNAKQVFTQLKQAFTKA